MKNKRKISKESFKKPIIKIILLTVLSGIFSAIVSSLGGFNSNQSYFITKIVLLIVVFIIYLIALITYEVFDINTRRAKSEIEKYLYAYEVFLSQLSDSCKSYTTQINTCIHEAKKNGIINLELWNFDDACMSLCKNIFDSLSVLCENNEIEIAYIKLKEEAGNEKKIYMNSFYNATRTRPSVFHKTRIARNDEPNLYYDARLFIKNDAEYTILKNKDEIDKQFVYKDNQTRNNNRGKYNQYIAIPVFCHDEKMVGLLEVTCLNNTVLGYSKEELAEIAKKYLSPFAIVFLLLHKLEKALLFGTVAK